MVRPTLIAMVVLTTAGGCAPIEKSVKSLGALVTSGVDRLGERRANDPPEWFVINGPHGVDVESFRGNVEIVSNPELTHGSMTVTRRALHGYGRSEEATESLHQIQYAYEVVPGTLGPTLKVRTWTTHDEPHFQRADLLIELPEVDGVKVRTQDGNVTVKDHRGGADVMTSDGDIRVMTPWPILDAVTLINHSGSIDYRIRGESTARFDGEALRGRVFNRVTHGELAVHAGTDHDTFRGTLNDGDNPVVLRAADGDIRIAVVPDPTSVGVVIVD